MEVVSHCFGDAGCDRIFPIGFLVSYEAGELARDFSFFDFEGVPGFFFPGSWALAFTLHILMGSVFSFNREYEVLCRIPVVFEDSSTVLGNRHWRIWFSVWVFFFRAFPRPVNLFRTILAAVCLLGATLCYFRLITDEVPIPRVGLFLSSSISAFPVCHLLLEWSCRLSRGL